jgi:thioredoxin 2
LTASPHELNGQSINKVIQKNELLTVVDFWASWCQPCIMMAPEFKAAAGQLPQVVFAKIQTDKYEQAAAPYNIRSLPTMVAFKNGKEVARQSGALPSNQIVQWIRSLNS